MPVVDSSILIRPFTDHMNRVQQHTSIVIHCHVTTDVRGNLGPASVLLQNQTTDWIHDRWQAASDMHGTNIQGPHSVQLHWLQYSYDNTLDIGRQQQDTHLRSTKTDTNSKQNTDIGAPQNVVIQRIVLDWEAAYSDDYDIQIWNDKATKISNPQEQWVSIFTMRPWKSLMKQKDDNSTATTAKFITTGGIVTATEWGQSPGVTFPTPLHIVHDIELHTPTLPRDTVTTTTTTTSSLSSKMRIVIHTSATGWGVSLWQVQVYGYYVLPKHMLPSP